MEYRSNPIAVQTASSSRKIAHWHVWVLAVGLGHAIDGGRGPPGAGYSILFPPDPEHAVPGCTPLRGLSVRLTPLLN